MDKQANTRTNPINLIPVNTRTVGTPEGIYILYLEDYVHTFIKKILSDTNSQTDAVSPAERNMQPGIALYGRSVEENGRYRLVISGAALLAGNNKIQQLNDTYFPSCAYIGAAYVSRNKDSGLRLELTLSNTKVILDDFYVYYDQNEEMQNYLIEWNEDRDKRGDKAVLPPPEQGMRMRNNADDAARLGRIAQAYNREEAKVSFMWNVMNVLCLGFVVCVMAYGIISINNYNKMQNMQASIDYCMAFVAENTSFRIQKPQADDAQTAAALQQYAPVSGEAAVRQDVPVSGAELQTEEMQQPETQHTETRQNIREAATETQIQPEIEAEPETVQEENRLPPEQQLPPQAAGTQPKQYYIVRRGDTLRTICFDIYGDYSRVDEICRLNNIEDPDNILYGQKLLLP